jgi:predicted SnoaL-like aldol condensation-catalyzing enzyme
MNLKSTICCVMTVVFAGAVYAQAPATPAPDQMALLQSKDPKLAANKKLVFDMYRAIIHGGHTEMASQFFTEDYIQHNPNVASGRDALVAYMKQTRPVRDIPSQITFPVVSIMAEGDLVMVATVSYQNDPEKPGSKYTTTHFDLFRVENGKIAEHWDNVLKSSAALRTDPNVTNKP